MKTLMNIMKFKTSLKESLLDNIEDVLKHGDQPYKLIYPVPTVKDFVKSIYSKHNLVKWQCPELIKPYINEIVSITGCNYISSKITGLACKIDNFKCISTYLINKVGIYLTDLDCIGDWVSNSLPTTKKECINFFKTILNDPETCFRKIIDYMQKVKQSKEQYGFADCITFEKLFK